MMRARSLLACLSAALVLAAAGLWLNSSSAWAQDRRSPPAQKPEEGKAKAKRPNNLERSNDIEFLFGALKAAPDATAAKAVENRILALWSVSGSDTTELLMTRVKGALQAKDIDLGITLLDSIVAIRPEYVEGWNRRATLHFMKKDYVASVADLEQVLAREPRHFGALVGLGMILQELENEKMALTVLRRAIELHPHLPRIGDMIKTLTEKVEGRPT